MWVKWKQAPLSHIAYLRCRGACQAGPTFLPPFLLGAWAVSSPSPTSAAFLALSFAFFLAFFFCAAVISCEQADSIIRKRAHGAMQPDS